jgi:peptidoglycan/LPS O-acetylase OafA/YrhL
MSKLSTINYKPEIDCLRAIAVLLVIFFHFELFNINGGFVGVDVFFVISGYLITNLVIKDIVNNKFSLIEFYTRRIRRIIPALYSTIFIVIILGYFILSPDHFNRIGKSGISAATAYSNIFFWYEAGYFDYDKYFKPLLHTWSLSVELQFYLIWPIIIFIIYKIFKKKMIIFILLIFLLSLFLSTIYSERTAGYFYFTLFRLFEFAMGSMVFLIQDKIKIKSNDLFFFIGILIIIMASFGFSEKSIFPGSNALVPSIGSALILITAGKLIFFKRIFINDFSIFFGKISYSLYLVHWPLIILYRYIKLEPLHNVEKFLLIFATIIISFFSYKFVELPFRRKVNNKFLISTKKMLLIFSLSLAFIVFISNYLISTNKFLKLSKNKQSTIKLLEIEGKILQNYEVEAKERINNKNYFNNQEKPTKILIWGDSHAGDLYNSLRVTEEFSKLDLEYLSYDYFYCFRDKGFNEKILHFIKEILKLSRHNCKEKVRSYRHKYEILSKSDLIILSSRWLEKTNFNELMEFIKNYSSSKVIIVGRKPRFFHIPTLYIKSNKDLNYLAYLNRNQEIKNINNEIKQQSKKNNFIFFDIENLICSNQNCTVLDKNYLLTKDEDHWSYRGYIFYGKMLLKNNFLDIILKNKS